jgi:hypothetical protein
MRKPSAYGSTTRNFSAHNKLVSRTLAAALRREGRQARASYQLSHDRDDLPNDLDIVISKLLSPMNSAGIRVNYQTVVLAAAASTEIASVTFENDIQRLLP